MPTWNSTIWLSESWISFMGFKSLNLGETQSWLKSIKKDEKPAFWSKSLPRGGGGGVILEIIYPWWRDYINRPNDRFVYLNKFLKWSDLFSCISPEWKSRQTSLLPFCLSQHSDKKKLWFDWSSNEGRSLVEI